MPDGLNVWMDTRKAPPLPFLPEDVHGKEIIAFALCYAGEPLRAVNGGRFPHKSGVHRRHGTA